MYFWLTQEVTVTEKYYLMATCPSPPKPPPPDCWLASIIQRRQWCSVCVCINIVLKYQNIVLVKPRDPRKCSEDWSVGWLLLVSRVASVARFLAVLPPGLSHSKRFQNGHVTTIYWPHKWQCPPRCMTDGPTSWNSQPGRPVDWSCHQTSGNSHLWCH